MHVVAVQSAQHMDACMRCLIVLKHLDQLPELPSKSHNKALKSCKSVFVTRHNHSDLLETMLDPHKCRIQHNLGKSSIIADRIFHIPNNPKQGQSDRCGHRLCESDESRSVQSLT